MENVKYFFDSYSIVELIEGNQSLLPYAEEIATITIFNLAEIYYVFLNRLGEEEANEVYMKYKSSVAEIDDETLKEAIKFRKQHKKQDLSYSDCIGYIYAKRHGMRFLTGDKEFEKMENVEFIM